MDRWQYLIVLAACLLITAPLEVLGFGVYRRPRRAVWAILPVAAVFIMWDALAIAGGVWSYNPRYVTGWHVPFSIPIEEIAFFVVVPICGLLTYTTVDRMLTRMRGRVRQS